MNLTLKYTLLMLDEYSFRSLFRDNNNENNKPVQWTNLNPSRMLDEMKKLQFNFPFKTLEDFMKRAGITNGYQSKPCLNPTDPECPETAPNKKSQQVKDPSMYLFNR